MFEGHIGVVRFQMFESLLVMFVGPLLLLQLSNSASYQKLAFKIRGTVLRGILSDYPGSTTRFPLTSGPCSNGVRGRDWRSLPRTVQGRWLRNSRI
jgi:hypothetical protein